MFSSWKTCAVALVALFAASSEAHATQIGAGHPFGLGVALGHPSAISGKYYIGGRRNAIEGVVGTWYGGGYWDSFYMHGVYMWHPSVLTSQPGFELPWHVGVGGFLADDYRGWGRWYDDDLEVGFRAQIGLDFDLTDVRLQFSGDIAANVGLFPYGFFELHPTISARYYF